MVTILFFIEAVLILGLRIFAGKTYEEFLLELDCKSSTRKWIPAGLFVVDRTQLLQRFPTLSSQLQLLHGSLFGSKSAAGQCKIFVAKVTVCSWTVFTCFTGLAILVKDEVTTCLLIGGIGFAATPLVMYRTLVNQVKLRKQMLLLELPEMLSKLVLLVGAGETVQGALIKCALSGETSQTPLANELQLAANELKMNVPLSRVMENLNKRCALLEVSMLATTILLNYKRGGDDFVLALKDLCRVLWEKRKSVTRTLGEEASSKLVFPMVIIFLVVMILVAAPAILSMNI